MAAACSSGHCVMRAERALRNAGLRSLTAGLLLLLTGSAAFAGEAPMPDAAPGPVPAEAEAAHQDMKGHDGAPPALDEAIFTEISPLTIPEIGIALPPDQEL